MDTIKELEKQSKEFYDKWRETEGKIDEQKLKKVNLDFIGKFVRYKSPLDSVSTYIYVKDVFPDKTHYTNMRYAYTVRGVGFDGEYTGYPDATWFDFDFMKEFYVYGNSVDEFKTKVDCIEVIDPDVFRIDFGKAMEATARKFDEYFNAVMFGKNEDLTQE